MCTTIMSNTVTPGSINGTRFGVVGGWEIGKRVGGGGCSPHPAISVTVVVFVREGNMPHTLQYMQRY